MNKDFHYYGTYCAAFLAGYSHEESLEIAYGAQLVDWCSEIFLTTIKGPLAAATTQTQAEMADARTDILGLQNITRIWSSFHFLPYDLYGDSGCRSRPYNDKFRLICGPNGALVADTVHLAKDKGFPAVGLAMHILADTWAHRYFAGTPSLVINNTNYYFYEEIREGDSCREREIEFRHRPDQPDDLEKGIYTNTIYQGSENSIMNLGHGRAGHLPDYSFIRYKYLPAWGKYNVIIKDNPSEYMYAFCQMVYAMKYLRGEISSFEKDTYDQESTEAWKDRIREILTKRQADASQDWKALGEEMSGASIRDFDLDYYRKEYMEASADDKDQTYLGQFILAALRQKSMVTREIFSSGNKLAGFSVDFDKKGFRGIKDYRKLIRQRERGEDL